MDLLIDQQELDPTDSSKLRIGTKALITGLLGLKNVLGGLFSVTLNAAITGGGATAHVDSAAITITGAKVGDVVVVTPGYTPEAGVSFSGYVSASNAVKVRATNSSSGAQTPNGGAAFNCGVVVLQFN